jgi:hypothetical protein
LELLQHGVVSAELLLKAWIFSARFFTRAPPLALRTASARIIAAAEGRGPLHDHKPRVIQMPDDMIGRDVGHQFVALVKALLLLKRSACGPQS